MSYLPLKNYNAIFSCFLCNRPLILRAMTDFVLLSKREDASKYLHICKQG